MINVYYVKITSFDEKLVDALANNLKSIRQNKINKCKNLNDKIRSAVAGCLIKYALIEFGIDYNNCEFCVKDSGYEYISNISGVYFSISHAEKYCVCAVSDTPVGVDIEEQKRFDKDKTQKRLLRILSEKEMQEFGQLSDEDLASYLATCWTRKEAYSKAKMKGLGIDFKQINTACNDGFSTVSDLDGYVISVYSVDISSNNSLQLINMSYVLEENYE